MSRPDRRVATPPPAAARRLRGSVACVAIVGLVALAGCGSSKPAYCTDRTNLQNSIQGLKNLNTSSGVSGLKTQLQKIQFDATALINSAKGDFPNETAAMKSSLDSLASAAKSLPSNPSASQVGALAGDASSFVNSVNAFSSATKSKCG
jgi:hypothetical protein